MQGWRNDIEGLRAIAIIPVLLFHFDELSLSGGFLGVDLFFVISGFLITKMLLTKDYLSSFSQIKFFFKRRFLRIFPSLIVWFPLFCLAFSLFVPKSFYDELYLTPVFSLLGVGNIYLAVQKINYFSPDSSLNPFLHSWSISLEDQFYIFYALLLFALYNKQTKSAAQNLIRPIYVLFILSIFLAIFFGPASGPKLFYLLNARLFEFLFGALAFLISFDYPQKISKLQFVHGISFLAIVCAFVFIDKNSITNIQYVLFCAFSGLLLIKANEDFTYVQKAFCSTPLRYIGRLSYSLYVVHYPIVKLLDYYYDLRISQYSVFFLYLVAIMIFAILNHKLVEVRFIKPYSKKLLYLVPTRPLKTAAPVLISIAFICSLHWILPFISLTTSINARLASPEVRSYGNSSSIKVVVVGDSHAQQLFPAFSALAHHNEMNIEDETGSACFLSEDLTYMSNDDRLENRCQEHFKQVIDHLLQLNSDNKPIVLLAMRSLAYLSPYLISKLDKPVKGLVLNDGSFVKNKNVQLANVYFSSLENTIAKLQQKNIKIIFLAPIPEMYIATSHCVFNPNRKSCQVNRALNEQYRAYIMKKLRTLRDKYKNFYLLDLFYDICPEQTCSNLSGNNFVFRDDDHITAETAIKLLPKIRQKILMVSKSSN